MGGPDCIRAATCQKHRFWGALMYQMINLTRLYHFGYHFCNYQQPSILDGQRHSLPGYITYTSQNIQDYFFSHKLHRSGKIANNFRTWQTHQLWCVLNMLASVQVPQWCQVCRPEPLAATSTRREEQCERLGLSSSHPGHHGRQKQVSACIRKDTASPRWMNGYVHCWDWFELKQNTLKKIIKEKSEQK